METFSALLGLGAGNQPVTGEDPRTIMGRVAGDLSRLDAHVITVKFSLTQCCGCYTLKTVPVINNYLATLYWHSVNTWRVDKCVLECW